MQPELMHTEPSYTSFMGKYTAQLKAK